jgi:hypothetical protein
MAGLSDVYRIVPSAFVADPGTNTRVVYVPLASDEARSLHWWSSAPSDSAARLPQPARDRSCLDDANAEANHQVARAGVSARDSWEIRRPLVFIQHFSLPTSSGRKELSHA